MEKNRYKNIDKDIGEVQENSDVVAGRNAVIEVIKSKKSIDCIYISAKEISGSLTKVIALAKEGKIVVKNTTHSHLDQLAQGVNHQGVVAVCSATEYYSVEDILQHAADKGEAPFIVICDGIEDPHNLGAIIRTAEACGVHGVIIPKRRSAAVNSTVYKTSAGAAAVLRVARVANLVSVIKELKQQNLWFYCADMDGVDYASVKYDGGVCLVIGSEGYGVSRLVKESCDVTVSLPMRGQINSLNASVAAGILMYKIASGR